MTDVNGEDNSKYLFPLPEKDKHVEDGNKGDMQIA